MLNELRPSSDRTMDCIRVECRGLEAALQKRQASLLSMVEKEEKNRTSRLQYQQEHLAVAATRISKLVLSTLLSVFRCCKLVVIELFQAYPQTVFEHFAYPQHLTHAIIINKLRY